MPMCMPAADSSQCWRVEMRVSQSFRPQVVGSGLEAYHLAALQVVGNDIVLTSVPEPASTGMLLAGVTSLLGLRRFRRRSARA